MSETVPVKVTLTGSFLPWTQGGETYAFEVRNLKGVLRELDRLFPGLAEVLEEDTVVAINGVLHEIVYTQVLTAGTEIYFIPKIESG